jgi:hypothetical protein
MIDLMTGGVAISKKDVYRKFTRYQYPSNIMLLGRTKEARGELKESLAKMTEVLHCSSKKIKSEFLPYFKIISKDRNFKKYLQQEFSMELSKS